MGGSGLLIWRMPSKGPIVSFDVRVRNFYYTVFRRCVFLAVRQLTWPVGEGQSDCYNGLIHDETVG